MSTRSNISIKRKDGTYDKIYCHSDGYLEYNGRILDTFYKDEQKICELRADSFTDNILTDDIPFDEIKVNNEY